SADGKQVLTGSGDGTAILWEVAGGKKLQTFRGHVKAVSSVALSRDGKRAVTGSAEGAAILWETASGKKLQTFGGGHADKIVSVAVTGDGKQVLTGSLKDGITIRWDATTGKLLGRIAHAERDSPPLFSLSFSGDGKHIVTGLFGGKAAVWDAGTGKTVQ